MCDSDTEPTENAKFDKLEEGELHVIAKVFSNCIFHYIHNEYLTKGAESATVYCHPKHAEKNPKLNVRFKKIKIKKVGL